MKKKRQRERRRQRKRKRERGWELASSACRGAARRPSGWRRGSRPEQRAGPQRRTNSRSRALSSREMGARGRTVNTIMAALERRMSASKFCFLFSPFFLSRFFFLSCFVSSFHSEVFSRGALSVREGTLCVVLEMVLFFFFSRFVWRKKKGSVVVFLASLVFLFPCLVFICSVFWCFVSVSRVEYRSVHYFFFPTN